jgi:hypothetical protein
VFKYRRQDQGCLNADCPGFRFCINKWENILLLLLLLKYYYIITNSSSSSRSSSCSSNNSSAGIHLSKISNLTNAIFYPHIRPIYVCMYVCMNIYIYMYMYMYVCVYICTYVCVCVYIYISMYVCVCVCVCVCISMFSLARYDNMRSAELVLRGTKVSLITAKRMDEKMTELLFNLSPLWKRD